jgi:predicted permease
MRAVLVVCQVSLAFILLIGAGLMTVSFLRVLSVRPGFAPDGVVTARLALSEIRYKDDARTRDFVGRLLATMRSIPGVKAAGMTTFLPFSGDDNANVVSIPGYNPAPGEPPPVPAFNEVDAGYFRAMGVPLVRGRLFEENDNAAAPKVVIIDEFLARKYWPKRNPVGEKIRRGMEAKDPLLTIVGVVGSVKTSDLAEKNPVGHLYQHYRQTAPHYFALVMKISGQEHAAVNAIRSELRNLDPELPLFDVKSLPEMVAGSVLNRKASMTLCLVFAALALVLSAVGIYGVLAYTVTQRTREFGIRLALGAQTGDVLQMVFRQGLTLVAVGLALGVAGAYALGRLMGSLVYDVKPADPGVFATVSIILACIAVLASLLPSLRATRIDPAVALRWE